MERPVDYKAMCYHLAGQMSIAVEALDAAVRALSQISEKLKLAQATTEEMFIGADDEDEEAGNGQTERKPDAYGADAAQGPSANGAARA